MPKKILKPFEEFFQHEAASGILLLFCAIVAIILANSPLAPQYEELLHREVTLGLAPLALSKSLLHWINDGLMAIFFLLVGLEIKRELVDGELNSFQKALLPMGAAIGGMVVPALIYLSFNWGNPGLSGWGIPMATDIAFALGALALLGSQKAPKGLAVFLTALAIIDDLGAILVIAIFYTEQISLVALSMALGIILALVIANRFRLNSLFLFLALGFFLWLAVLKSGIHATIAGVILGLAIPVRTKGPGSSLLHRLEHALSPWVAFAIMPLFALANAGVSIEWDRFGEAITHPVSLGIILGLFVGKQLGIFGGAYLLVRLKAASLPQEVTWQQIYGAGLLGGIGFTMSLFISTLAFQDQSLLALAKFSVIIASALAGIAGLVVLSLQSPSKEGKVAASKVNEAV